MRKAIVRWLACCVAAVGSLGLTGCALLDRPKATCGWGMWMGCPSTINTEMPVLVNQGTPYQSAQPVGTVAGPVIGGTFSHGGGLNVVPQSVQQLPMPMDNRPSTLSLGQPSYVPSAAAAPPRKTLTCEEWCELMRQVQKDRGGSPPAQRMPPGEE